MLRVRFEEDADVPCIYHSEVSTHNSDILCVWNERRMENITWGSTYNYKPSFSVKTMTNGPDRSPRTLMD